MARVKEKRENIDVLQKAEKQQEEIQSFYRMSMNILLQEVCQRKGWT